MGKPKVSTPIKAPTYCDVCCSTNVELTTNDKLYRRLIGRWPHIYYCTDCKASVGCHPNTFRPLGKLADKETRQLRMKAHSEFDQLWKRGYMTRDKAYTWLALQLDIAPSDCHMSQLTKEQLKLAAKLSKDHLEQNAKALLRRRKKQDAREFERNEREHRKSQRKRSKR